MLKHTKHLLFAASRGIGAPPMDPKSLSQKTTTNEAKQRRTKVGFSSFHRSITTMGIALPKISKRLIFREAGNERICAELFPSELSSRHCLTRMLTSPMLRRNLFPVPSILSHRPAVRSASAQSSSQADAIERASILALIT